MFVLLLAVGLLWNDLEDGAQVCEIKGLYPLQISFSVGVCVSGTKWNSKLFQSLSLHVCWLLLKILHDFKTRYTIESQKSMQLFAEPLFFD